MFPTIQLKFKILNAVNARKFFDEKSDETLCAKHGKNMRNKQTSCALP